MGSERVLISGATGLIGQALLPALLESGATVHALTRRKPTTQAGQTNRAHFFEWDGVHPPDAALRGVDAVVHLAGEPIFGGLVTQRRLRRMVSSRIDSTHELAARIAALDRSQKPRRFICASAVGFYGDRADEKLDEASVPGRGFLPDLCRDWERVAEGARSSNVGVVRLRFGIILSRRGGALPPMRTSFGLCLGGQLGTGHQWVPWVHLDDAIGAILLAIDGGLDGPVNVVAPNPVTNRELTHELAKQLGRPGFWTVPGFALRAVLGEIADELLGSKQVVPGALGRARYRFRYPELAPALAEELS